MITPPRIVLVKLSRCRGVLVGRATCLFNASAAKAQLILQWQAKRSLFHGSTYERVSWFIKGVQIIQANPLGNGLSHLAFGHYMRAEYPNSLVLMTHSAWIDYTLGLGLPGLLLVWAAIGMVLGRSFSLQSLLGTPVYSGAVDHSFFRGWIAYIAPWLLLGMLGFWFVGEVSEREYLEHYFFLIALLGMGTHIDASNNTPQQIISGN